MENSVAYIVIIFIMAAAAVGLACQLAAMRSYTTESKSLDRAQREFAALDPGVSLDMLSERVALTARSVVGHRLSQVRDIARSPAPPSVAELSAADFERDDSRLVSVLPNTLISILLIIGLAGTLVSFKAIFGNFHTETKTQEEITKWLNNAYQSFSTAFHASLCGIGATVLLLIFRSFVHNKRAELLDRLDRFTAGEIYVRFVPQQATDSATLILAGEKLIEYAGTLEKSVGKLAGFPDALSGATNGIIGLANEMRAAVHVASGTFADFKTAFAEGGDVRASLRRLETIADRLGQQARENTEALRETIAVAGKSLGDTAGSVKQTGENIAATSTAILAAAGNTAQAVQGIAAHISAMDTLTAKLGGVVEKNSESHDEWAATIAPAIHSLTENANSLTEVIPPLAEVSKSFADTTRQIEESAKQIASAGEEHTKRFGMTAEKIERMGSENVTTQREFLTGIGAALGAQAAEIGRHFTIAGEAQAERFKSAAQAFAHVGAEIAAGQREFLARLQPVLVELPRQVIEMARQQAAQTEKIAGLLAGIRPVKASRGERAPEKLKRNFFRRLIFWRR
jgi:hypothetical protein